MLQFNIAIYITIFFLSITGCDHGCERLSTTTLLHSTQDSGKPLIVLFHGLGSNASCFNIFKKWLQESFPEVDMLALRSVEEHQSVMLSIKEQANCSFKELLNKQPDIEIKNRPIVLIGHSQGGGRAYKMYCEATDVLNIKGIITIATPWEGAPILNVDQASFLKYLETPVVIDEMESLAKGLGQAPDFIKNQLKDRMQRFQTIDAFPGCSDLKPASNFLCELENSLRNQTIPILAIGGRQSKFKNFLTQKSEDSLENLNKVWTEVIIGKTDDSQATGTMHYSKDHDMVVPLSSQLALNIVLENNTNFRRFIIKDAIHDDLLDLPPNKKSKNILEHPDMFKEVRAFANEVLYGGKPKASKQQMWVADIA